jgi:hypothetical protein
MHGQMTCKQNCIGFRCHMEGMVCTVRVRGAVNARYIMMVGFCIKSESKCMKKNLQVSAYQHQCGGDVQTTTKCLYVYYRRIDKGAVIHTGSW